MTISFCAHHPSHVLSSDSDIAYELMLDMEKNGPEPNIYTYNTVTRAFAESGRLQVT